MKPLSKTMQAVKFYDEMPRLTVPKAAKMAGVSPSAVYAALMQREGRCGKCGRLYPKHRKSKVGIVHTYEKMTHPNPPPQLFKTSDENALAQELPGRTSSP